MRKTIEATYTVETPLFMAGADQKEAELRVPSFKGVLRFWWRALAWSRMGGDLSRIKAEEDWVFGSSEGGQSRVVMSLARQAKPRRTGPGTVLTGANQKVVGEGARYLGYGLMHAFFSRKAGVEAGELMRSCLNAPFDFTVRLLLRDGKHDGKDGVWNEGRLSLLRDALRAMGLLGGMGARSRRGWGSLRLKQLTGDGGGDWHAPDSRDALLREIQTLLSSCGDGAGDEYPPYTALSPRTRVVVLVDRGDALHMLDLVGRELLRYRGWGYHGKVLGKPTEGKFEDDHDLMKKPPEARTTHPRRVAFGLPHNYGKGHDNEVGPADGKLDRRASPLFIHVQRAGREPVAVVSFLPAVFLPGDRPKISVGGRKVDLAPPGELYRPIEEFMDRLATGKDRKEPFKWAKEVKP